MKSYESQETDETLQPPGSGQRLTYWIAAVALLLAFGLSDAAVIAWSAGLMTGEQLLAWAFAYIC
jgi:hypothetical protein